MKVFFLTFALLISSTVFCQTFELGTLTKEDEKIVKTIQKDAQKRLDKVLEDIQTLPIDRRNSVHNIRAERDSRISQILNPAQSAQVMHKDPINWDKALDKINKQEAEKQKEAEKAEKKRLEAEKKQRLQEIKNQERELKNQQKDLERQQANLKSQKKQAKVQEDDLDRKESELKDQKKRIQQKEKDIKNEYK